MIICALVALLLGIGSAKFSAECGNGLGAELRKEEYRKLQGFSFSNIDRFRVSSLVTRLTSDITTVQNTVSSGLRPACRAPVMMLTAILASFLINAKMAVVFLIATPLLAVLLYLIDRSKNFFDFCGSFGVPLIVKRQKLFRIGARSFYPQRLQRANNNGAAFPLELLAQRKLAVIYFVTAQHGLCCPGMPAVEQL